MGNSNWGPSLGNNIVSRLESASQYKSNFTSYRRTSIQHKCLRPTPSLCSLSESFNITSVKFDVCGCLVGRKKPLQSVKTRKSSFLDKDLFSNISCGYISLVLAYFYQKINYSGYLKH